MHAKRFYDGDNVDGDDNGDFPIAVPAATGIAVTVAAAISVRT